MKISNILYGLLMLFIFSSCTTERNSDNAGPADNEILKIDKAVLKDKIKGAWAGQTIGCTYGGPTEFRFKGTMIQDYQPIPWYDGVVKWWYENSPGLYDDVYMDLTFVDIIDQYGLNAPVDSFALAFANAGYMLWHANQAARYNILNGIMPPASGHWQNNPHADCIDYQIEADFAGIMSPGMPNTASEISDKIGHIMNYGDGWYGGVYVGAMYSLAFISDDIEFIVKEALKTIPEESDFYKCVAQTIESYYDNPDDWTYAWWQVEKNWSEDVGCPDGALDPFNIDAKVNAAYIIIGLLYGEGDFSKTIDIATRCGQDSDCNPASAGGILATVTGYDKIPEIWKKELKEVEEMDFRYTTISLNDVYGMSYRHALQNLEQAGGKIGQNDVQIKYQKPVAVKFEKAFDGLWPVKKENYRNRQLSEKEEEFNFEGRGVVIAGNVRSDNSAYEARCRVVVDGKEVKEISLPASYTTRSPEFYWNYDLPAGAHSLKLLWLNPEDSAGVSINSMLVYGDNPVKKVFE